MASSSAPALSLSLAGNKLRDKLGRTLNESAAQGLGEDSFARRQMAKMGWDASAGLGKRANGRKEHVRVERRVENLGLGAGQSTAERVNPDGDAATQSVLSPDWWKDSVGGTLAKLQAKKKEKKSSIKNKDKKDKKKKRKRASDEDGGDSSGSDMKKSKSKKSKKGRAPKIYTDEELFEATGGARFGMRAQSRKSGKWKRTESANGEAQVEEKPSESETGIAAKDVSSDQASSTYEKNHESSCRNDASTIAQDEKAAKKAAKKAKKEAKKVKKEKKSP